MVDGQGRKDPKGCRFRRAETGASPAECEPSPERGVTAGGFFEEGIGSPEEHARIPEGGGLSDQAVCPNSIRFPDEPIDISRRAAQPLTRDQIAEFRFGTRRWHAEGDEKAPPREAPRGPDCATEFAVVADPMIRGEHQDLCGGILG